ncbi:alpha/beta fold hydrolase [Sphaerisporangium fuscum]|uniref:alpha/beta fold hydrolase n=1 Tax=Sphaerisporangium fuscum TaxID=2835868 RepID=UPI001BDC3AC3|nr:alpha/beta fold hydrolase [Sphaerisporangium fuscum]
MHSLRSAAAGLAAAAMLSSVQCAAVPAWADRTAEAGATRARTVRAGAVKTRTARAWAPKARTARAGAARARTARAGAANAGIAQAGLTEARPAEAAAVTAGAVQTRAVQARTVRTGEACPSDATCGTLVVPLDRTRSAGSTRVAYMLVRRRDPSRPAEGTIAPNPGGPGVGVIAQRDFYGSRYHDLLATHDLLLVDPRGVGRSDPLRCPSGGWDDLRGSRAAAVGAVAACGRELGEVRRYYTSAAAADDIDDVRAHLGIGKLTLIGQSYGSYLMTVYARRHPRHVRTMVLSSAYPLRFDMLGRPTARAMRRAVRLLCRRSGGACDGDQVLADLATVAARLRREPVRYADGDRVLDETALASTVYKLASGHADLFGKLPLALRTAVAGDTGPLVELAEQVRPISGALAAGPSSMPLFVTMVCNDYPALWDRDDPVRRRARTYGARLARLDPRDYRPFRPRAWIAGIVDLGDLCLAWPGRPAPSPPGAGRLPDVPVLVLSGELDTSTPTEEGLLAADQYRDARVVEVPSTGHVPEKNGRASACAISIETGFIRLRRVPDTGCLRHVAPIAVERVPNALT